ncbi:intraflagellar transport protein 140 homolog [Eriocheir sinensis]|uniref:intraflagellar transport protein 140 homolog n=2 Tax=Eriocheir sinensis TaxID=95602 RepID=UPI0021C8C869|nr:intraflagellar transport protein 140 homolog [Eriocheir sinensis]
MSLYFDCIVDSPHTSAINTQIAWHAQAACLAVAAYSEEKGGTVNVYTGEGKLCEEVDIPPHPTAQVTSMVWHPSKRVMAVGWESGELFLWNDHEHELREIQSLHRAPISILQFSAAGTRLVSADASGATVGWRVDNSGDLQTVFTHELKDPLVQVVYRVNTAADKTLPALDINGLARAAVSGDERALDIFSSWRPRTGHKHLGMMGTAKDNLNFFLGSSTGVLYHVNESGNCVEVLQADGGIKRLLHHESRSLLVVITESLVLGQFSVAVDGSVTEINRVKLSGRTNDIQVTWSGAGLLAVSTGDNSVRLWNLDSGDNYVLSLRGPSYRDQEFVMCLSYSANKNILCAGTNLGSVAMWKYEESKLGEDEYMKDPEKDWKLQNPTVISGTVKQVAWGSAQNLLGVNTVRDVYILNEQHMVASYKDQVSVVQVSPTQLSVDVFSGGNHLELKAEIQVRGVHNSVDHLLLWNMKKMVVYEITSDATHLRVVGSFPCEAESAVLHEGSIYSIEGNNVQVRSLQGTVKQTLNFSESEGQPIGLDVCGNFLVASTINGTVKLWDLSRREAKPHTQGKQMGDYIKDFGEIISARCNCNGTRVSIAVAQTSLLPDPKLYVWDIESESFTYFNFASGRSEDDDIDGTAPPNSAESVRSKDDGLNSRAKRETAREVGGRFVMSHMWDAEDPRLLVCEAKSLHGSKKQKDSYLSSSPKEDKPAVMLVTLFVSPDHGNIVQDAFPLSPTYSRLLGVQVPFFYLLNTHDAENKAKKNVTQKVMREFTGLESCDKATKDAMLNFSFYLSIGNMDDAFKAIKTIKSETVWENMAKMCVKTKRLDVAALCLGNMGHARGARALRYAMKEPELDARVAMLALQLGMLDEAERLYRGCGRNDLVNRLHQDAGVWSKALEVAENHDRIHLRSTHYNYAKHLESKGDFSGAISHYEKSDTHRFEVPRMLFDDLPTLEDYIMHTKDKALRRWWAQYLESTSEMETALQFYEAAHDHLSLVRVYCYCNNLQKAADIANETGDRAACYHLARQYENVAQVKEAIHFFTRAQAYGNAIRICKDNGFDDQLLNLALVAGPQEQIDAARYFSSSERRQLPKAVMLYHKAGLLSKAVDLAFKSGQISAVGQIAGDLDESADPALIQRCAQYFISNGQYDRAVSLLITGRQYFDALDLCVEHNVWVTEELAERFTLPKDEEARNQILEKVAECAYAQENYKLATKKFTQAGNKVKAMKCLLKSSDTERIVYFANVCRQREIYIMAANYLQSLDWRKEPEIMRNIIQFYSRAKASGLLAGFYDSCAQVEIDEFQNYDKAAGALNEAYKVITSNNDPKVQEKLPPLKYKLEKVTQFNNIKRMFVTDGDAAIQELQQLLADPNIEVAVRQGDIYAVIVEYFAANNNFKSALNALQDMKAKLPKANPSYYVDAETLQAISRATGMNFTEGENGVPEEGGSEEEGNASEEEVVEEDDEEERPQQQRFALNGSAKFF